MNFIYKTIFSLDLARNRQRTEIIVGNTIFCTQTICDLLLELF